MEIHQVVEVDIYQAVVEVAVAVAEVEASLAAPSAREASGCTSTKP